MILKLITSGHDVFFSESDLIQQLKEQGYELKQTYCTCGTDKELSTGVGTHARWTGLAWECDKCGKIVFERTPPQKKIEPLVYNRDNDIMDEHEIIIDKLNELITAHNDLAGKKT